MTERTKFVMSTFAVRRCFICDQVGPCAHRELEVEFAYYELDRIRSGKRKPVRRAHSPSASEFNARKEQAS